MADNAEIIGGVAVTVEADLSDLQAGFDSAVATATRAGEDIASALTAASDTTSTDALTQSLQDVGNAAEVAGSQMAALADEPQTLAEYYDQLEAAAIGASSSTEQLGSTVSEAAGNFTEASAANQELTEAVQSLSERVSELGGAVQELGSHLSELKHHTEEAKTGFQGFAESLTALAEAFVITEGLKEFATEALSVYGNIQKASIALTALTGSAETAEAMLSGLKDLAITDALSFPQLVDAAQRMTAFGVSVESIPGLLNAASDAGYAGGRGFDAAANAMIRMSAAGTVSGRMLVALGLNTEDLGKAMDVASTEVSKAFKELDQSGRLEVLSEALQKFAGLSQKVAQGILGEWQNVKTQFEFVMEGIGKALAPAAMAVMKFLTETVIPAVQGIVDEFNQLPEPIQAGIGIIGGLVVAIAPLSLALAGIVAGVGALVAAWPLALTVLAPVAAVLDGIAIAAGMLTTAVYEAKLSLEWVIGATVSWKDALLVMVGLEREATVETKALAAQQSQLAEDVKKATDKITEQGDKLRKHMLDLSGVASASRIAADMAEGHKLKLEGLSSALTGAQQHLDMVEKEFSAGLKTDKDVTKAYEEVTAATDALKAASASLSPEAKKLADYLKLVADNTAQWRINVLALPAPIATVSSATEVAAAAADAQSMAISLAVAQVIKLGTALVQAKADLDAHRGSQEAVTAAADRYAAAQENLNKLVGEAPEFDKVDAALMAQDLGKVGAGIASVVDQLPALQPFTQTLEQIDEEWAKNSRSVNRLAKYDLPAAIQAYQTHIDQLKQVGAANGEIYASQEKLLQIQIDYRSQFGADATAQIVALTNIKEKVEALQTASQNLGEVYAGFVHTFDDAFTELGSQLTDATVHAQSFGQAFHNVVKKIESDIVGTLINGALKELKAAIVNLLSGSGSGGGILGSLGGILGGSSNKSSSAALTAAASSMQSATTRFSGDVIKLDNTGTNFRQSADSFKSTNDVFRTSVDSMRSAVDQFQQAVQTDSESTDSFGTSASGFDDSAGLFDDSSGSFDDSASLFDSSASSFGSDVNSFGGLVGQMSSLFGGGGGIGGILGSVFSIFGFQGGGEVPSNVIGLLHPHEMVLPPNLADGIRSMVASGSTSTDGLSGSTININSGTLPNLSGFTDAVNGFTDAIASSSRSETPASPVSTTPSVSVSVPQAPSPRIAVPSIQAPEASAPKSPAPRTEPEPSISSATASAFRTSVGDFAEIAGSLGKLPVAVTNFKTTTDSFTDRLSDFGSRMGKAGATSTAESGTPFSSPGLSGAVGLRLYAFEGGGDVPGNVLALLHAQEMVLPAPLAQGLRNLFAQGGLGGNLPSLNLSLPSVPSSVSSHALPSTGESSVSGGSDRAVFENCTFTGVTQTMVNDLMNKVVQATRRAGSRF